jgi:hypothetical protein
MPPVHAPIPPAHPYRELLNFVLGVPDQEINRASSIGQNRQSPGEWGPYFRERERELQRLVAAALAAENQTQFSAVQIERRVRALEDAVVKILLWQRDAKDDANYLVKNNNAMWPAWRKVQTLAIQAEAEKARQSRLRSHDPKKEARDKWIYELCCEGVAYDTISRRLAKKKSWDHIQSKQGIFACARKYAERKNLEPPPSRQSGN